MANNEDKFFENLVKFGASDDGAEEETARPIKNNGKKAAAEPRKELIEEDVSDGPEGQLTIDVYQTPGEIVVESAIAGVRPEDLDINVSTDSISIRGQRHHEKEVRDEDYFYQECYWGRFARSVILPQEIDPDHATVSFKNGILTVHLPKINRKKSKKLKVRFE